MSPGATFERVYNELKRMLAEGELPPGSPIEPALIGKQIASSITPIRDALHRLTGERLVEAPDHNGFRVPLITEATLRDLYVWTDQTIRMAARGLRHRVANVSELPSSPTPDLVAAIPALFLGIARLTGSAECAHAVENLNDRLALIRRVEIQVLSNVAAEYGALLSHYQAANAVGLARTIGEYHRRRLRAVDTTISAIARL